MHSIEKLARTFTLNANIFHNLFFFLLILFRFLNAYVCIFCWLFWHLASWTLFIQCQVSFFLCEVLFPFDHFPFHIVYHFYRSKFHLSPDFDEMCERVQNSMYGWTFSILFGFYFQFFIQFYICFEFKYEIVHFKINCSEKNVNFLAWKSNRNNNNITQMSIYINGSFLWMFIENIRRIAVRNRAKKQKIKCKSLKIWEKN